MVGDDRVSLTKDNTSIPLIHLSVKLRERVASILSYFIDFIDYVEMRL